MQPPMPGQKMSLPGVKHVIAVASGKGGVGKSTVAANLALALHMHGQQVGLMDADIYGPSVPIMFGLGMVDPQTTPFPLERFGLKLMSMGFLVDPKQAVIWRGPKVAQAVQVVPRRRSRGATLDFLVIDLPPGTGRRPTHAVAAGPAHRGHRRDHAAGREPDRRPQGGEDVPRGPGAGPRRGREHELLRERRRQAESDLRDGGGRRSWRPRPGCRCLGELPIDPRVAECGDTGEPIVRKFPDSPIARAYLTLARLVIAEMAKPSETGPLPEVEL